MDTYIVEEVGSDWVDAGMGKYYAQNMRTTEFETADDKVEALRRLIAKEDSRHG